MADRLIYELLFSLTASPEICQTSKSKRLEPFDNAVVGRENMTPPVCVPVPTVCDMTTKNPYIFVHHSEGEGSKYSKVASSRINSIFAGLVLEFEI
jgi:hypothetical protein